MIGPDLIRLAQELARCGGMHRLTNLVTAAVHVHLAEEDARIDRLESCLRAILAADERGQGTPFAEAMDEAARLVAWGRKPRARTVEAWENGPEVGVGMSDKVALASTPDGPAVIELYRTARDGMQVQPTAGMCRRCSAAPLANPAPQMALNGERKPLKDPEEWR